MVKAINKIIIIALMAIITVVMCFTTVIANAEAAQEYYYFETVDNIYGFGIDDCNRYYVHDFVTPVAFVIENGEISNQDIKDMINNNAIVEQRLISTDGIFTYDIKLYLKDASLPFSSAAYAYKSSSTDTDGNDVLLKGEPLVITGTAVNVKKIEVYVSYNDYYLDVNYSNSDSFFRIYNNVMAREKYWSTASWEYGFLLANAFNVVDFSAISSDFFLNIKKDTILKNDIQELTDETMFIYPFLTSAGILSYFDFFYEIFGNIAPINTRHFFNDDTTISGYVNINGEYMERNAEYIGINELNNRQIWRLKIPINIDDFNAVETLEFCARNNVSWLSYVSTDIILMPAENIIINNNFSWGSLLELTGIFGVAVDLILQILNYEILGIELGFLIFAPLLLSIALGIIKILRR